MLNMRVLIQLVLLKIENGNGCNKSEKNKVKSGDLCFNRKHFCLSSSLSARAGLKAIVVIPEGKIALGKLSQAVMYGAEIVSIEGNFDEALEIVKEIAQNDDDIELVNSVNPFRIEGQKQVHLKLSNN